MKYLPFLILILTLISCENGKSTVSNKETKGYYIKTELTDYQHSRFFKDYDVFQRKGMEEVFSDTLRVPFFQVYEERDSSYLLVLFTDKGKEEFVVPIGNKVIYSFHDIGDGPRHIYSRIENSEIIRYGYGVNPYEYNEVVMPEAIEVIKRDTFYIFNSECLDTTDVIDRVLPFKGKINRNCDLGLVQYYSKDTADAQLYHYYKDIHQRELSKEKPGNGIYGFKRKFKYWRDFHNLKRMI